MNKFLGIFLFAYCVLPAADAQASAAVNRQRAQQQAIQQQAIQKAAVQQAIQERAIQQLQAQRIQQELAIRQRAQVEAQMRQQAAAQAQIQAQQQIAVQGQIQQRVQAEAQAKVHMQGQIGLTLQDDSLEKQRAAATRQVVTLNDVWKALETSSEVWDMIIDRAPKEATLIHYIDEYRNEGVYLRNTPAAYVDMIDGMSQQNPEMLQYPFKDILRVIAIINYDFDNGQDKDEMALRLLGRQGYLENRKRFQM